MNNKIATIFGISGITLLGIFLYFRYRNNKKQQDSEQKSSLEDAIDYAISAGLNINNNGKKNILKYADKALTQEEVKDLEYNLRRYAFYAKNYATDKQEIENTKIKLAKYLKKISDYIKNNKN